MKTVPQQTKTYSNEVSQGHDIQTFSVAPNQLFQSGGSLPFKAPQLGGGMWRKGNHLSSNAQLLKKHSTHPHGGGMKGGTTTSIKSIMCTDPKSDADVTEKE